MSTFASTAIPMVRIMPAMPGSEKVKPNMAITPKRIMPFTARPNSATIPAMR
jgi:hypothetical protein